MGLFGKLFGRTNTPRGAVLQTRTNTPKGESLRPATVSPPKNGPLFRVTVSPPAGPFRSVTVSPPRLQRQALGLRGAAMESVIDFQGVPHSEVISEEEMSGFLERGEWLEVNSSWIARARYEADTGDFTIQVIEPSRANPSGQYTWPGIIEDQAYRFAIAVSKGGFCWDEFWRTKIDWAQKRRVPD